MRVASKAQNFRLWTSGAYGNRLRAWRTVAEWQRSGFTGRVALRYVGAAGGPCVYDLKPEEVVPRALLLATLGWDLGLMMVNEGAPDHRILLQGELYNGALNTGEVDRFEFSTVRSQMRDALRVERRVVSGVSARLLLRDLLSPGSQHDLLHLLERFPGHVLEISVYEGYLGDVPRRNALVWEIRDY